MCSAPFYRDLAAPGNGFMLVEAFLVKEAEALNMLLNPRNLGHVLGCMASSQHLINSLSPSLFSY